MFEEKLEEIIYTINKSETKELKSIPEDIKEGMVITLTSALESFKKSEFAEVKDQLDVAAYNVVDIWRINEETGARIIELKNLAKKTLPLD